MCIRHWRKQNESWESVHRCHAIAGFDKHNVRLSAGTGTNKVGAVEHTHRNLKLEAQNLHMLLLQLSEKTSIPVGFEVSPKDNLSLTKRFKIQIEHLKNAVETRY